MIVFNKHIQFRQDFLHDYKLRRLFYNAQVLDARTTYDYLSAVLKNIVVSRQYQVCYSQANSFGM